MVLYIFQDYIARFGHGSAKLAKQAQSKEKVLAKMVASGLTEKVVTDKVCQYIDISVLDTMLVGLLPAVHKEYAIIIFKCSMDPYSSMHYLAYVSSGNTDY